MFGFSIDLGTFVNLVMTITYLAVVVAFPFIKINDSFGIRQEVLMNDEKLWHKTHVLAAKLTFPFLILSIISLFIKYFWLKIVLFLVIIVLVIIMWNIAVKVVTKDIVEAKKKQEEEELMLQKKKESGWR